MRGFARGGCDVVHRAARVGSAAGPAVGWIGGGAAIRAAPGAGAGDGSADRYRSDSLWRLETPAVLADAVRGHRGDGRSGVAALPDEKDGKGANLGVNCGAARPRVRDSVLGSVSGAAAARRDLCLQAPPGTKAQANIWRVSLSFLFVTQSPPALSGVEGLGLGKETKKSERLSLPAAGRLYVAIAPLRQVYVAISASVSSSAVAAN